MRLMSFSITTRQFRERTKSVTRRSGWRSLRAGDRVMGAEKCMGLRRGQRVQRLGAIEITDVRREPLSRMLDEPAYGRAECIREGFPELTPAAFVDLYCRANRSRPTDDVTRLAFAHVDVPEATEAGAEFEEDDHGGRHRLALWRRWGDGPRVHWLMLNPSTADEQDNDRTLDRITGHSARWGYGALTVTNLYSFCATTPRDLWTHAGPLTLPAADVHTARAALAAEITVCAWGANGRDERAADVLRLVPAPHVLAGEAGPLLTASGHPVHPLTRTHPTKGATAAAWPTDSFPS